MKSKQNGITHSIIFGKANLKEKMNQGNQYIINELLPLCE